MAARRCTKKDVLISPGGLDVRLTLGVYVEAVDFWRSLS
jgi:hypothetical protein